jgi:aspartate-semialdehyde dehydrogenase
VAVLGATGIAGQQFLAELGGHPLFEVTRLGASERSAGRVYEKAITDDSGKRSWYAERPLPEAMGRLSVENSAEMPLDGIDLAFTAVESDAARTLEPRFAEKVPVISTAAAFRYEPDVPVFIPGVNLGPGSVDHTGLIDAQRKRRGWKGFITPGPNCTTTGLAITLRPLADAFGLKTVMMTSLQSVSGAGRSPGVIALDITDNVVPYIAKEEEKVEKETRKILGRLRKDGGGIDDAEVAVSCTCTRVNVLNGHTESVFVGLERRPQVADAARVLEEFGHAFTALKLPSSPRRLVTVSRDPYRPQPRLDRDSEDGMTTTVGRLREEPVLGGVKYVLVSHNTKMGAAKGALLTAEYLVHAGVIK